MKPQQTCVSGDARKESETSPVVTNHNSSSSIEKNPILAPNNKGSDDNSEEDFYFETDHVALKGNKDYLNLLKTVAILEAQRIKAVQDVDKLLKVQDEALKNPVQFVEKLQNGELNIPVPQVIVEVPIIDWSQYNVTLPADVIKPTTRKASSNPTFGSLDSVRRTEEDAIRERNKILVRGRIFDDSKPETFNQSWTTEEQRRLEELLEQYPSEEVEAARWKKIAAALGNRTAKQVCSRVQKYFLKLQKAGLPIPGRAPKSQPTTVMRRPYHRHQKNNHFLFRQTTFFPCQDVPVFMSEFDDEIVGTNPNLTVSNFESDVKEETGSDDDQIILPEKEHNSSEYHQLQLLRRVVKEKELEDNAPQVEHTSYKCNFCEEEPIVGSRWHCVDCSNSSVDFCTDCVITQLESVNPHPLSHQLVIIRRNGEEKGVWDQDYLPHSFTAARGTRNYNYLDPNFMPE